MKYLETIGIEDRHIGPVVIGCFHAPPHRGDLKGTSEIVSKDTPWDWSTTFHNAETGLSAGGAAHFEGQFVGLMPEFSGDKEAHDAYHFIVDEEELVGKLVHFISDLIGNEEDLLHFIKHRKEYERHYPETWIIGRALDAAQRNVMMSSYASRMQADVLEMARYISGQSTGLFVCCNQASVEIPPGQTTGTFHQQRSYAHILATRAVQSVYNV
tara:strand:+ start:199 stop:837 length:639 start_codon:yes stop_codon:yes gene_type:complete